MINNNKKSGSSVMITGYVKECFYKMLCEKHSVLFIDITMF